MAEPQPITDEQRAAWARLWDAATPGPWIFTSSDLGEGVFDADGYPIISVRYPVSVGGVGIGVPSIGPAEGALIAAAPEAMRLLLAENEALRAQRDYARTVAVCLGTDALRVMEMPSGQFSTTTLWEQARLAPEHDDGWNWQQDRWGRGGEVRND